MASQMVPSALPSSHDTNLVDILLNGTADGEFVRDQIAGTHAAYDPGAHTSRSETAVISAEQLAALREREVQAVRCAESGELDQAITQLSALINEWPQYASAYNNRAQARRLQGLDGVIEDLDTAIRLAADRRTLAQAFTQKGVVLREMGDQDGAFYCFSQGAKHGNEVAKMAAARENPYAKMCGNMVAQAMQQLRGPQNASCTS
ncbi:Tetratricopeptide repeat protein 36 [Coemansia spiralis]|nr:Tetratricopeptide repeat protein 36 [Coemansia spiralis]